MNNRNRTGDTPVNDKHDQRTNPLDHAATQLQIHGVQIRISSSACFAAPSISRHDCGYSGIQLPLPYEETRQLTRSPETPYRRRKWIVYAWCRLLQVMSRLKCGNTVVKNGDELANGTSQKRVSMEIGINFAGPLDSSGSSRRCAVTVHRLRCTKELSGNTLNQIEVKASPMCKQCNKYDDAMHILTKCRKY